jgi:hypothetical protein
LDGVGILLGSNSVLRGKKKRKNKTKICFGTVGLLLHVAWILGGFYFVGR